MERSSTRPEEIGQLADRQNGRVLARKGVKATRIPTDFP